MTLTKTMNMSVMMTIMMGVFSAFIIDAELLQGPMGNQKQTRIRYKNRASHGVLLPLPQASCYLIIMAFILIGCASSKTNVPVMPKYGNQSGKACAQSCQATYNQCNIGCSQMVEGGATASQQQQCLGNCNQRLKTCYAKCKNAPKLPEQKRL